MYGIAARLVYNCSDCLQVPESATLEMIVHNWAMHTHMLSLLQAAHQCVCVSIGDGQGEGDQEHCQWSHQLVCNLERWPQVPSYCRSVSFSLASHAMCCANQPLPSLPCMEHLSSIRMHVSVTQQSHIYCTWPAISLCIHTYISVYNIQHMLFCPLQVGNVCFVHVSFCIIYNDVHS